MFKPMLAPNEVVKVEDMKFPLLVSFKLDGIRCIFKDGQMLTRSLKTFPNKQIRERFKHLAKLSKDGMILDGELLAKSLDFNTLSGLTRQLDKELPNDLNFYVFDCIPNATLVRPFSDRISVLPRLVNENFLRIVPQKMVTKAEDVVPIFKEALEWGCDGLILRDPQGEYKCGRGTVKEALIYKLKPYQSFDAKIIGVIQATEVNDGVDRTVNELGRHVTSKKQGDRHLIDKACAFVVIYNKMELKVSIALTDAEKMEIWTNRNSYLGRYIEYKGMLVGAKDLPRHPVFLRYREDKE